MSQVKALVPMAARGALAVLGAKAAKEFLGDGKGGFRDLLTEVAGAVGGLWLSAKVLKV